VRAAGEKAAPLWAERMRRGRRREDANLRGREAVKVGLERRPYQAVLIIHDAATYPGLVLKCKPIGVLEVVQTSKSKKERNDRVFVVPDRSPFEGDLQDIRRLPSRAIEELEKFFEATDALESKKLEFQGWRGPSKAIKTIKKVAL
jgi:inorganic pyrophosphatase